MCSLVGISASYDAHSAFEMTVGDSQRSECFKTYLVVSISSVRGARKPTAFGAAACVSEWEEYDDPRLLVRRVGPLTSIEVVLDGSV